MSSIDSTARIASGAQIGKDVAIGPYCVIGPQVTIGEGCRLAAHVNIAGRTTIGARTSIAAFASLGTPPQSVHYHGEDTTLTIGADCDIREHVTINIGTAGGRGTTTIGDHCFLMVGSHVGHDCNVGNQVIFANNATLGGFCEIGDFVFLGGLCAVHQFARIGEQAIIGGLAGVAFDVIPFAAVVGHRAKLSGLNRVGLKRRGYATADIQKIYRAYRDIFFGEGTVAGRVESAAEKYANEPLAMKIVNFIRAGKSRRLMTPRAGHEDTD
ncbi:MAG: acyl-[acyl-carrier-protein]--UDP-N-acetylglucosamine O-acyltransferase [Pseudolabrys sp.]|jgi:UDP-N-acetylglucosamine acyltransferase|nr:acyl-[acyl-carrier-protein]--UDP-N-acetylglucosamine O-acyltransferase [Pseudolabrys sp.]